MPPETVAPVEGLNHSNESMPRVAPKSTVSGVPLDVYPKYSALEVLAFARPNPLENKFPRGLIAPRFTRFAYARAYPRLSRKLSQRGSGAEQTPCTGKQAEIAIFARIIDLIRIHKQNLISAQKVFPNVSPILLCSIVPYAKVAMIELLMFTLHGGEPLPQVPSEKS